MALQPKLGHGLLYRDSVTIIFYSVRLLASRPTPVKFEGPVIFCCDLLPKPKVPVLRCWKPALHPTLICCTTHCALPLDHHDEVESLGLLAEPAGSFMVFNRACLLASACPTRAIPAFGPVCVKSVLSK
jgi:hypothetical protein